MKDIKKDVFVEKEIKGMFEGSLIKLLIKLAFPIFAGMAFQLLYNIIDTIWISRIDLNDPSYVGGIGIVFPIVFFGVALANGILIGMSSLVARGIGEKNSSVLNKTAESGMVIAILLSVVTVGGGYLFDTRIIALLGGKGDYYIHALAYFRFIIPSSAIMYFTYVFAGILQGEGMMKNVMKAMILGTILNIVLDPVFIFLLNMDVRGAALATCISQAAGFVYIVSAFRARKTLVLVEWKLKNIKTSIIKQITVVGLPQAMAQIIMSVSFLIINRLLIDIDKLALTSFSLVGRFNNVILTPILAIGAALITIIGQNAGRKNFQRVKDAWYTALLSAFTVIIFTATVMVLSAPYIYPFFSDIDRVVYYAVLQTRIMSYTFLLAAFGIIGRSVFQAIGHPMPAFIITMLRLVIIAIPAAYIYVYVFNLGVVGVFFGLITGNIVSAVISFLWVKDALNKLSEGKLKVTKVEK